MNNETLEKILFEVSDSLQGSDGFWQFELQGIGIMIMTDESHNRMRIICPIMDLENVTDEQMRQAMSANFHTSLDVRYAAADGLMWSAFIHPLKELNPQQVLDGIQQAHLAAKSFGTTYHSTDLSFPGNSENEKKEMPKDKKI